MNALAQVGLRTMAVLAAAMVLSLAGLAGVAQASSITGLAATSSTFSADATAVVYTVTFTTTNAIPPSGGFVKLTAPSGATLSTSTSAYSVTVANGSPAAPTVVTNDPGGAGDNVTEVDVPSSVPADTAVTVAAAQVSNPTSAAPSASFIVETSTDTTAVSTSFPITAATAVSGLTASATSPDAGSEEVADTVTFTATTSIAYTTSFSITCPNGACNTGSVTLTLPTGTVFDTIYGEDYSMEDVTTGASQTESSIAAASGSSITLQPSFPINAGDQVKVVLYEVTNPTSPETATLSVSTSSDAASPATSVPFDYGPPDAPSNVSVATTSTTGAATGTTYLIGLTTVSALPIYNGGSDGTGYIILTFPSSTIATGFDNATVYMSDAAHPTLQQSNTTPGQYGVNYQNQYQVEIPVAFATPAHDNLTVELVGVTNPSTFSYPTVSTSGDTLSVTPSVPTGVSAVGGAVSAQLSWTAPPTPSGATVDYIITPFIGSTAQTPIDTLSSGTSFDVTGLTAGTAYTLEVQAKLTDGSTTYLPDPYSAASNSVTPTASGAGPAKGVPSATTLAFGTEFLGFTTAAQTVTLTNTGGNPLAVSAVTVTGAAAGDYTIGANSCTGHSVASGKTCSVSVTFKPTTSGARSASLVFTDNSSSTSQAVALTGTGTDTATVSGTVASAATGAPVANVRVDICANVNSEPGAFCGSALTSSSGTYTISSLGLGAAGVDAYPTGSGYHATEFATTLVLGPQTLNISLPVLHTVPSDVTISGAPVSNGFPAPSGPMSVAYTPTFPSEPAGTVLAFVTSASVSEVDTIPAIVGWTGAVALIVSYGPSGTPRVIGQYSDTASDVVPALNFQATSPGASQALIGPGYPKYSPLLVQYLPNGQLQMSFTSGELYPGTKQFSTCTRTAVLSSSNTSVQVQAHTGSYTFGAVSPTPQVSGCTTPVLFDLYFDPSGIVESTSRIPLDDATVTLLRASTSKKTGPFKAVPKGSTIMSASNRRNPDHTSALGSFGWDVSAGYYRVEAAHPGCTAGGSGRKAKKTVQTRIYVVPPPVDNIVLKLKCPDLKRSSTHLRLSFRPIRGTMTAVTATVRGKSPAGGVTFSGPGVSGVSVPVNARTHAATFILTSADERITAKYTGDAHNAPSSASGHAH